MSCNKCTSSIEKIIKQILEINPDDYDHIIFCCGQLSRLLIYELWDQLDKKLIDIGSVCDMYNVSIL